MVKKWPCRWATRVITLLVGNPLYLDFLAVQVTICQMSRPSNIFSEKNQTRIIHFLKRSLAIDRASIVEPQPCTGFQIHRELEDEGCTWVYNLNNQAPFFH